jgi:membrane associated rhomboid family serine protease
MSSPIAEEQNPIGVTPAVQWLLVANIVVYFLQQTVVRPDDMVQWFGFISTNLQEQPWRFLTYAFVHGGLLHIAFNMLALWQFGPRVERLFGTKRFAMFYLWCALGGALLHLSAPLFVPTMQASVMIGASAAVFGVMLAYAHAWPRQLILFFGVLPMQVRWYIVAFAVLSLFLGLTDRSPGVAHWAHLGGFVTAWLLVRLPSARRFGSTWQERISPAPELPEDDELRAIPRTSAPRAPRASEPLDAADDVVARSNALVQRRPPVVSPPPRPAVTTVTAAPVQQSATEELNALLDKMSSNGGRSGLSAKEQERLHELSAILRGSRAT